MSAGDEKSPDELEIAARLKEMLGDAGVLTPEVMREAALVFGAHRRIALMEAMNDRDWSLDMTGEFRRCIGLVKSGDDYALSQLFEEVQEYALACVASTMARQWDGRTDLPTKVVLHMNLEMR